MTLKNRNFETPACPHGALSRQDCGACMSGLSEAALKQYKSVDYNSIDSKTYVKLIQELLDRLDNKQEKIEEGDLEKWGEDLKTLIYLGRDELGIMFSSILWSKMFGTYLDQDPEMKSIIEASNVATLLKFPTYKEWIELKNRYVSTPPRVIADRRNTLDQVAFFAEAHRQNEEPKKLNTRFPSRFDKTPSSFEPEKYQDEIRRLAPAYELLANKLVKSFEDAYGADSYDELEQLFKRLSFADDKVDPTLLAKMKELLENRSDKVTMTYKDFYTGIRSIIRVEQEIDKRYPSRPNDDTYEQFRNVLRGHSGYYPEDGVSFISEILPGHHGNETANSLMAAIDDIKHWHDDGKGDPADYHKMSDKEVDRLVKLLQKEVTRVTTIGLAQQQEAIDE